jgi:hypothetical protein
MAYSGNNFEKPNKSTMEEIIQTMLTRYQNWENSSGRQKSGYLYERSFTEMWQTLGKEVFQRSMGELPKDKNSKKNFKPFGVR